MNNLDGKTLNSADIGEETEERMITLTRTERLILINQYKLLGRENAELRDYYEAKITVLENGFEFEYDALFDGIEPETLSREHCKLVRDSMYLQRRLDAFFQNNPKSPLLSLPGAKYPGFDGQEEGKFKDYASYLMSGSSTPEYWEKVDRDSHSPSLDIHEKRVSRWRDLEHKKELSLKDVEYILLNP